MKYCPYYIYQHLVAHNVVIVCQRGKEIFIITQQRNHRVVSFMMYIMYERKEGLIYCL